MTQSSNAATAAPRSADRGLLERVLDLFSSVWGGVFLATLLFLYCSIGSAMPAVRQHPVLEMTEFEWFHWWPFNLLVLLFCTNIIFATVRRIPLRLVNAGVWMIHAGIIILCIGSYVYFGTKVEGDAPVFRRRVRIELPGLERPATLLAVPGSQTRVIAGAGLWRFEVQATNTEWTLSSEPHQGQKAYTVNVLVTPPTGDPFVRLLLAGFPQYTEDVIPGQGRAVKATGRALINEDLKLTFDYEPQVNFHVMQTWALFVRRVGESEWSERPIRGLPRYNDRIGSREHVFLDPHHHVPLRTIDLAVPAPAGRDALGSAEARVTGYLRYAQWQQRWRDGGERLNPVLRATLLSDQARSRALELVAFDRTRNLSENGMVQFDWLDDFSRIGSLPVDSRAMLKIKVPSAEVSLDVPITPETVVGSGGPFTKIQGTEFSYRIASTQDNLALPDGNRMVSVAMVDIEAPDRRFRRMVADQPEMTRDMHGESHDPHSPDARKPGAADPRITTTYQPPSAPIIYAAYPEGLHLVVNGPSGRMLGRDVEIGELIEVVPGLRLRADSLLTRAVSMTRPFVVPPSARRRDAGETFAMIRLEVGTGHQIQTRWLPFSRYVFPNEQYAYQGRFAYQPERFHLPDGSHVEIVFSRERRRLPSPIALEDFTLDAHIGGYTGQTSTIRNYVSQLRFFDDGEWTAPTPIQVNAPTEHGGYWYFQSMWDKPSAGSPGGGMNYTGLGVGNRKGVYVQLAGCCLAVTGMLFAFYVKPLLKRHRREEQRVRGRDWEIEEDAPTPAALPEEEPVEVSGS